MLYNDYHYHIYNRGVEKRQVFMDESDYRRFLTSLEEFNFPEPTGSLYELSFKTSDIQLDVRRPNQERLADVIFYCLNPNHYHLLLRQKRAGGISEFIKRLSGGYTKYFNNKYSRSGALFQGKYKRKEIKTEGGLTKLSVYINCNAEIHGIDKKENWPWSSYKETLDIQGKEFKDLCEQLLPDIKQIKNLGKYGLE